MKVKNLLLFIAEIIILFLWGVEFIPRIVFWLVTWSFYSWRIRDMWFAKVYTWIQTFRPLRSEYKDNRQPFNNNFGILVIPLLLLFACNSKDNLPYYSKSIQINRIDSIIKIMEKDSLITNQESNCITINRNYNINPRSYQIETYRDSIVLYDGSKRIGSYNYRNTVLDSLITQDNQ